MIPAQHTVRGSQHTVRQCYLEAKDTADEEQNDENQAHVAQSRNLLFIGEVLRLHSQKNQKLSYIQKRSLILAVHLMSQPVVSYQLL